MNTRSLIAKFALYVSVIAMIAFSMDSLAQPTQVRITAPATDGTTATPGSSVTFTGTATDTAGLPLTYTWNFSDGTSPKTGQTVTYPIPANATAGLKITATLNVTNSLGELADMQPSSSVTVGTASAKPTGVSITAPAKDGTTVNPGSTITFTGSATDPNGLALTYAWNFSDNTSQIGQTVNYAVQSTAIVGSTITAKLTVTNSSGVQADTQPTRSVTIGSGSTPGASGNLIYVTNYRSINRVTLIDTSSNEIVARLSVNSPFYGYAVTGSNDGNSEFAYLVLTQAGKTAGTVSVIDKKTRSVTAQATVDTGPYGSDTSLDGQYTLSTNSDFYGSVTVTKNSDASIVTTIPVGSLPLDLSVTPDGKSAYVSNYLDGTVSVIDIAGGSVTKTINVGPYPFRIGNVLATSALPFKAFNLENLAVAPAGGALSFSANFTLDDNSVGIAPTLQTTALKIGSFFVIIPPGGFVQNNLWSDSYRFEGSFKNTHVNVLLQRLSGNQFLLQVFAYNAQLIGLKSPTSVQLSIGKEQGSIPSANINIVH